MTAHRQALIVAAWEFRRYFKWRDQILGFVIFLVISGLGFAGGKIVSARDRTLTVGVEGIAPRILAPLAAGGRLRFVEAPPEPERAKLLREGTLRGVLTRQADGRFSLLVDKDPRYRAELEALLTAVVQRERLAARGLTPEDLGALLAPPRLDVRFADPDRPRPSTAETILAAVLIGLVIMAVFTGMAYLLTGITGEKQLRVTESIVSFVPPQVWIDGKILGIAAYSLVNVAHMVIGGLLIAFAASLAWGFTMPDVALRPSVLALLLVFSGLTLLLWNAAFAAFAATIDDPNTSTRTAIMFLPMLFVGLACWQVLRDPDAPLAQALAIFPLTSGPALPVRAILSSVGPLEVAASLALLLATIWLVRRAAGRIFEIGILMYGKEPSLREIARWARAAPPA